MAGGKIVQSPKMGEVAEPIRAYHSSPHDFEKFDLSKIGTGQGAQSYGHGIYLAENPAVSGQGGQYWQEFARHPTIGKTERDAADFLALHNFDRQAAAKQTRAQLERNADFAKGINSPEELASRVSENAEFEKVVRLLESGRPVGPRTYEVGIHAPREAFLDWDKPLAPKTPVRGILADLGMKGTGSPYADIRNVSKDAFLAAQNPSLTGEGAYRSLARAAVRPEDVRPGFSAHSPTMASEALREAGIPGVKYLDQGSRNYPGNLPAQIASEKLQLHGTPEAAIASLEKYPHAYLKDEHKAAADLLRAGPLPESKGTSNFVVWSPEIIQIMRKYGLAGAVPAGMGALAAQDRYAEQ
jgi:hypothetical protein